MKKPKAGELARWQIIAKKGRPLATGPAKDAESGCAAYAKEHGLDPKRLMALRIEE